MAIGKRKTTKQQPLWVAHHDLAPKSGHPFYTRLNRLLNDDGFDAWLEKECAPYFSENGRPSIPPGVYFRMLFIGYLEGFPSERAIAWHCQDGMSIRDFLGYRTPDHSSFTICMVPRNVVEFVDFFMALTMVAQLKGSRYTVRGSRYTVYGSRYKVKAQS